mmetsp:Transcript_15581/g.53221  ORF Transcript_15581/g.53221 Transcript_15581/m.53221 type:complete len:276 (-) Transcript_15581:329-1156(-)
MISLVRSSAACAAPASPATMADRHLLSHALPTSGWYLPSFCSSCSGAAGLGIAWPCTDSSGPPPVGETSKLNDGVPGEPRRPRSGDRSRFTPRWRSAAAKSGEVPSSFICEGDGMELSRVAHQWVSEPSSRPSAEVPNSKDGASCRPFAPCPRCPGGAMAPLAGARPAAPLPSSRMMAALAHPSSAGRLLTADLGFLVGCGSALRGEGSVLSPPPPLAAPPPPPPPPAAPFPPPALWLRVSLGSLGALGGGGTGAPSSPSLSSHSRMPNAPSLGR